MEEEKNRLTIELENEQRVTLGITLKLFESLLQCIRPCQKLNKKIIRVTFLEVEHWLRDRHKFLSNLHEEWTNRLRDEVAAKEAELQALIAARNADK